MFQFNLNLSIKYFYILQHFGKQYLNKNKNTNSLPTHIKYGDCLISEQNEVSLAFNKHFAEAELLITSVNALEFSLTMPVIFVFLRMLFVFLAEELGDCWLFYKPERGRTGVPQTEPVTQTRLSTLLRRVTSLLAYLSLPPQIATTE